MLDLETLLSKEFQYNIITITSVIWGFSFTSISIFLSVVGNSLVKQFFEAQYLNNLYESMRFSSITGLWTIILSMIIIITNTPNMPILILEAVMFIATFNYFIYSLKELFFIIKIMKKSR